jgi:hypothetical protein
VLDCICVYVCVYVLFWPLMSTSLPVATTDGDPSQLGEGHPPPVSDDVKGAIKEATAGTSGAGLHSSGQDAGMQPAAKTEPKVKTEKECT